MIVDIGSDLRVNRVRGVAVLLLEEIHDLVLVAVVDIHDRGENGNLRVVELRGEYHVVQLLNLLEAEGVGAGGVRPGRRRLKVERNLLVGATLPITTHRLVAAKRP